MIAATERFIELLKRWSEKEPKRCFYEDNGYRVYMHAELGFTEPIYDAEDWLHLASAEYAVKEAIEDRGWDRSSESIVAMDGTRAHHVTISGKSKHDPHVTFGKRDCPEAMVWLAVYLQALESTA